MGFQLQRVEFTTTGRVWQHLSSHYDGQEVHREISEVAMINLLIFAPSDLLPPTLNSYFLKPL